MVLPINYRRWRGSILFAGFIVLVAAALVMSVRGVDPVEVTATLFFLPVFAAFVFWGVRGGTALAGLAAVGYVIIRVPAAEVVGWDRFSGVIASRIAGYAAFGVAGGWAVDQLRASLQKLDLHDEVDDETGLGNARSIVESIDLERLRSQRYEKVFSVVTVTMAFGNSSRKERSRVLKAIGEAAKEGIRSVDHIGHAAESGSDVLALVLPETGNEGATALVSKLVAQLSELLDRLNADGGNIVASTATFPGDDEEIERVEERFRALNLAQHPQSAE